MKDLKIEKSDIDSVLRKPEFEYVVIKKTPEQYVLKTGNGLLNIYFKKNSKVSFLAQGQDKDEATAFAERVIAAASGVTPLVHEVAKPIQAVAATGNDLLPW
ncbi:MAG TPA: hypothetical protein VM577_12955 [Anaerovoracaceae bacterium]|nr:hypothetical protein [Anaerovoracaceae bacterium]